MNGPRKILIFFVLGRLDEAIEVLFEPKLDIKLLAGRQAKAEIRGRLKNGQGYESFQLKRGESFKKLVARMFDISTGEIDDYSIPQKVLAILQDTSRKVTSHSKNLRL